MSDPSGVRAWIDVSSWTRTERTIATGTQTSIVVQDVRHDKAIATEREGTVRVLGVFAFRVFTDKRLNDCLQFQ